MQLKQKKINFDSQDENNKEILLYEMNNHLVLDEKPSEFFNSILDAPIFKEYPFSLLYNLKETRQSPIHHPEGNAWNHTMLVVDAAAKEKLRSKNQRVLMWAALLHDIGKPSTTKINKEKITSYDHEKVGAILAKEFLKELSTDRVFIEQVSLLIKWHMQILHVAKNMRFADIKGMKEEEVDFSEVALLGYCDRLGRKGVDVEKEKENIKLFLRKCEEYK